MTALPFAHMTINDQEYEVLDYIEGPDHEPWPKYVLLRLDEQEMERLFQKLRTRDDHVVEVKERGRGPRPVRLAGGAHFWSRHTADDGSVYYKQQLVFIPPIAEKSASDDNDSNSVALLQLPHYALASMVVRLESKLHALSQLLAQKDIFTADEAASVVGEGWRDMVSADDQARISRDITRIPDAADAMPRYGTW